MAICKCPTPETPTDTAHSSSVVNPKKELKPEVRLEEGDSIDIYTTWLYQFQAYFQYSNFDQAEPNIQRIYLSDCLDSNLWKRLAGGETTTQKALPINPRNFDSGLFADLKLIFDLQDPSLQKGVQRLSTQLRKLHQRLQTLENSPPQTSHKKGRRYENIQRKKAMDKKNRQASGKNGINAAAGQTENVNTTSTANRKHLNIKTCKQCSTLFIPKISPHVLCKRCWKKNQKIVKPH